MLSIEPTELTTYSNSNIFGHSFTLKLSINNIKNTHLIWLEKTDNTYTKEISIDKWESMLAINRESPIFKPWVELRKKLDEGIKLIELTASPSIFLIPNNKRTLDYFIAIKSNYETEDEWHVWMASQTLETDPEGKIKSQKFRHLAKFHGQGHLNVPQ
ncbi:hypothetical protein [Chromobacterium piscinae]|uniref:hypothetical protein n=1 Tax=Chromobacterium piscinae TaxID=686831 RepID=UPI003F7EE71B